METIALVGPSGTGKSHRASLIAYEYNADLIIDDGLVICGTKILAGRSAKREETRVAAVRRALFEHPDHAEEVIACIREVRPKRVLVLGTSKGMINRIIARLGLPKPKKYLMIEDIAKPEEIRRALRVRREQGKHVIPAPTLEVKRTFSGYLVAPLRLRLFGRGTEGMMSSLDVEKSVVRPTYSSLGKYSISDAVIVAIARQAAKEVDGVNKVVWAMINGQPDGVVIRVETVLDYGVYLPDVMVEVQRRIGEVVERMTALNVLAVDVVALRLAFAPGKYGQGG